MIHAVFVFVCLTYFTKYDHLLAHPCCCKWRYFTLFYDCELSPFADFKQQFVISCDLVGSLGSASWQNNWIFRRPTQKLRGLWRSRPRSTTVSHGPHSIDQRHGASPDAREKEQTSPSMGGMLSYRCHAGCPLATAPYRWQRRPTFSLPHCVFTSPRPASIFLLVKWRYWGLSDQRELG